MTDRIHIPSASAMRDAATGVQSARARALLASIVKGITDAAPRGALCVCVEGPYVAGVAEALREQGYTVTHRSDQREGSWYDVRWA